MLMKLTKNQIDLFNALRRECKKVIHLKNHTLCNLMSLFLTSQKDVI